MKNGCEMNEIAWVAIRPLGVIRKGSRSAPRFCVIYVYGRSNYWKYRSARQYFALYCFIVIGTGLKLLQFNDMTPRLQLPEAKQQCS